MKDSRFAKPKVFVGIIILLLRVAAALCQINNRPPTNYIPLNVRDALTTFSAGSFSFTDFCPISTPWRLR
jgi:hypothetical protein